MPAPAKLDIINQALALLGEPPLSDEAEPDRRAATIAASVYEWALRSVLRDHMWSFSRDRASLALSASVPPFGYARKFSLPSDFVRLVWVNSTAYTIEGNFLLTDDGPPINIVYVKLETDTAKYDPMFVEAFMYKLAQQMALPLTGTLAYFSKMGAEYKTALQDAKAVTGQEIPAEQIEADEFDDARWTGAQPGFRKIAGPT